jgi:hypothetical protein
MAESREIKYWWSSPIYTKFYSLLSGHQLFPCRTQRNKLVKGTHWPCHSNRGEPRSEKFFLFAEPYGPSFNLTETISRCGASVSSQVSRCSVAIYFLPFHSHALVTIHHVRATQAPLIWWDSSKLESTIAVKAIVEFESLSVSRNRIPRVSKWHKTDISIYYAL